MSEPTEGREPATGRRADAAVSGDATSRGMFGVGATK